MNNETIAKISAIKNMFMTEFPHEGIDFKIEFFNYLESIEDEETLNIFIKIFRLFHLTKYAEKQSIINELENRLGKRGINFKFQT